MDIGVKAATSGVSLSMVLALTGAGRAELGRPQAGLSLPQRKLLSKLDGRRRLADLVGADVSLTAERVARDALRLLTLGLAQSDESPLTRPAPTTVARTTTVGPTTMGSMTVGPTTPEPTQLRTIAPEPNSRPMKRDRAPDAARSPRGRSKRLWIGGAVVVVTVVIAAIELLFPAPDATRGVAVKAISRTDLLPTTESLPPTSSVAAADVTKRSAAPDAAPAVAERPAAPTDAAARNVDARAAEPRAVNAAAKPDASASRTKVDPPVVERSVVDRPIAASAATAKASVPVTTAAASRSEPSANAASAEAAKRTTPAAPTPSATPLVPATAKPAGSDGAVVVATAPAIVSPAAPPAAPPSVQPPAAAPSVAAPRELLPNERDFAPADLDPERLAQQAAGRAPVQRTPPIYPRAAIRQGLTEGSVRARLFIAADGSVERVETSVTDPRYAVFERPARAALMTWVFVRGAAGRVHDTVINFRAP